MTCYLFIWPQINSIDKIHIRWWHITYFVYFIRSCVCVCVCLCLCVMYTWSVPLNRFTSFVHVCVIIIITIIIITDHLVTGLKTDIRCINWFLLRRYSTALPPHPLNINQYTIIIIYHCSCLYTNFSLSFHVMVIHRFVCFQFMCLFSFSQYDYTITPIIITIDN